MNEQKYTKEEIDAKSDEIYHILFPKIGSESWKNFVDNAPSNVYRGAFLRNAFRWWVLDNDHSRGEESEEIKKQGRFLQSLFTKEDWKYSSLTSNDSRHIKGCEKMAERAPEKHPKGWD